MAKGGIVLLGESFCKLRRIVVAVTLVGLMACRSAGAQSVTYTFTQFPYKETVSNEKVWSEYEVACAQSPRCLELRGVHHTRCVRQCVSPSCYLDIYTHDEITVDLDLTRNCGAVPPLQ
ncbi:uncharacterized protein LOC123506071 isoform X2 [Portunus trituberculatus]|uniref:uncharacterized protein LOC123506071 isoform X2 n=1 Tax=Portunus trituberculatus TaxID=210409 RepID=UPI001E1D08B2|nr:uncharacterized protein LOC123506071 isoform X2 [Portunus trituberculatus]